ncbi:hypothetical protein N657DRAFT_584036 [Parathielavia appendiculata]|uniref:Zn(2)-C6 fungal-type domain-containing protein n=1 Tax=Parathielavia appendiculata TaxID=2587402 RepID=A0AAN6TPG8_9PEZI|nr:hypothetical protein N657DRAFT_584036 [Parathielavia appendiculata]
MEPERRRRRPAVSCILCRRRKIRCNRETPCSNCAKSKNATCVYRDPPRPPRPDGPLHPLVGDASQTVQIQTSEPAAMSLLTPASSEPTHHGSSRPPPQHTTALTGSTATSAAASPSPRTYGQPSSRRPAPEQAVSSGPSPANTASVSTFTRDTHVETKTLHLSDFTANYHLHTEHRSAGQSQSQVVTKCVTHKTRLFGQSHWVNAVGLLSDMIELIQRSLRDPMSKLLVMERRCKSLAKVIKARRRPPWPCPPTPELPGRLVCDALVECYLDTSEAIFRVLHVPSFRRDYEAVWDPSRDPDPAFLVQLKLVLAIGAAAYDSTFSLRPYAIRWVYEAQTWLSEPEFKSRLDIPALQTSILLLMAREATGVGEEMVWATLGTTVRIAMYMGLHRDTAGLGLVTVTLLVAEMRRRLWNTILELMLHSSLTSGAPPLITLDEFDTKPPGNFDDDQLTDQEGDDLTPRPDEHFTQTTIAIALRSTFPQRLAVAKHLNDLSSRPTYSETLKLDAELREAYRTLTHTLQACKSAPRSPSELGLRTVDLILRWFFIALHFPFFAPALREAEFAFSRRAAVENALRFWRTAFPHPLSLSDDLADDRLGRIAINGSGFFRTTAVRALVGIAIELQTLAREEQGLSLGPVELRPDLLLAMEDFTVWAWKSLETGQTNAKCYLVAAVIRAQFEAVRQGLSHEDTEAFVFKEAEAAEERALGLLEAIEASGRQTQEDAVLGVGVDDVGHGLDLTTGLSVDWNYLASDAMFSSMEMDPMSWVLQ